MTKVQLENQPISQNSTFSDKTLSELYHKLVGHWNKDLVEKVHAYKPKHVISDQWRKVKAYNKFGERTVQIHHSEPEVKKLSS